MIKASWSISCDIGAESAALPLIYIEAETRAEAMAKASRLGWQFDGDRCMCPIHRPVGVAQ